MARDVPESASALNRSLNIEKDLKAVQVVVKKVAKAAEKIDYIKMNK